MKIIGGYRLKRLWLLSLGVSLLAAFQASALEKRSLIEGEKYYITGSGVNVRSSESTSANNVVGKLFQNDQVLLVDRLTQSTPLVEIKVLQSSSIQPSDRRLYVSKDYLSLKEQVAERGKYFVIQNIATEKTRVYERCVSSPGCPHKMIFETDMIVGRPEVGTDSNPHAFKTRVGHAKITEWVKFYSDVKGHYPPWYTAGQSLESIPQPLIRGMSNITAARSWTTRDSKGNSTVYGAFGWYAAKVQPAESMDYQWIHGTIGWGKDQDRTIQLTRGSLMNLLSNPGSSGCTRVENQAIAYLRHILPVGTDIFRVYAKETTAEPYTPNAPLSRYRKEFSQKGMWSWILLTDGANKTNGLTADAAEIYRNKIRFTPGVNMIERGFYYLDQHPDPVYLNPSQSASSGLSGDRYEIGERNFRGYFLVDEGRFVNYRHPDYRATGGRVIVGGLPEFRTNVPSFLAVDSSYYTAR